MAAEWVVRTIEDSGYLGVGFLMFAETVFPPIPSEIIMSLAGLQAAQGELALSGVIGAGTAGAMLGNTFWYLLARALGLDRIKPWVERWGRWITMTWDEIQRGQRWFDRFGAAFVFLGRIVPTVRSRVSVPAGLLKMSFSRFVFWSTLGTAIWPTLLATAGYQLGQNDQQGEEWISPASNAIIVTLVAWYLWRVATWNLKHRFRRRG